jgi:DNA-binding GntR family transcriptional regulator
VSDRHVRELCQEIYVQDLALALYGVYVARLTDAGGRACLEVYLAAEAERRRRLEEAIARTGFRPAAALRRLFAAAGRAYGGVTSWLGTRVMLRIVLSASRRASRRACARLEAAPTAEQQYLAALRARNEGDLVEAVRQHLIDTRPQRS